MFVSPQENWYLVNCIHRFYVLTLVVIRGFFYVHDFLGGEPGIILLELKIV